MAQTRNTLDFADILRYNSDILYPRAERIGLAIDSLNIHSSASLYKALVPEGARRLAKRFEWHYTLKHRSWTDIAEIVIEIMSREALDAVQDKIIK